MSLTTRLVVGALLLALVVDRIVIWGGGHPRLGVVALTALIVGVTAYLAGRSIAVPLSKAAAASRTLATGGTAHYPQSRIPEIETLIRALRQSDRDVGEQLATLRRSEDASAIIVEAMGEGIIAADARGQIVLANRAARTMLGYPDSGPLPDLRTLFRLKDARLLIAQLLDAREEGVQELTLGDRMITLHTQPLVENGVLVVLRDRTAVRRLEMIRRDFVANVSHELKTPLTSIAGYAETLLSDDPEPDTRHAFLRIIRSNTARMQALIDDLLDLSRIESGRWIPRPEEVSLGESATLAWQETAGIGANPTVTFALEIAASADRMRVDPGALRQILTNLFDNAVRHVGPAGTVTLRAEPRDGMIEVTVVDNGSGIPHEHLDRIFERFYRIDPSRSRAAGGTGLGLAIVRHMVEAHGGRIAAESSVGVGTTIRLTLPAA